MSLLRTISNPRLLSVVSPRVSLICRRHESDVSRSGSMTPAPKSSTSDPPAAPPGRSTAIRLEDAVGVTVKHNSPDWGATVDHATSGFSPVPKRVMDGSEPGEVLPAAVLSGAPIDLQARTVRIYRPTKTSTQSGTWHGRHWRMDWDVLGKGHRWENFLMGWQSSGDCMQGTHLNFTTKEDAISFAEKQGYEYFVSEHNERKLAPKAYANNFLHTPNKLKHIRTK